MDKIVNFVIYAYVTTIKKIFKFLVVFVLVFFETRSHYAAEASLELKGLQWSPECSVCRTVPAHHTQLR